MALSRWLSQAHRLRNCELANRVPFRSQSFTPPGFCVTCRWALTSMGQLDALLARLGRYSTARPRTHAGVLFSPGGGLGGVPDGGNIDYRGFQAYMRPRDFLGLNPPRQLDDRPIDHIASALRAGEPIGTPILYVRREGGGWNVKGHEGRGRMMALDEVAPQELFPVGVHPYGELRARHLNPEDLFLRIFPDSGGDMSASPAMAILNQTPYVRPGMESDEAVLRALMDLAGGQ